MPRGARGEPCDAGQSAPGHAHLHQQHGVAAAGPGPARRGGPLSREALLASFFAGRFGTRTHASPSATWRRCCRTRAVSTRRRTQLRGPLGAPPLAIADRRGSSPSTTCPRAAGPGRHAACANPACGGRQYGAAGAGRGPPTREGVWWTSPNCGAVDLILRDSRVCGVRGPPAVNHSITILRQETLYFPRGAGLAARNSGRSRMPSSSRRRRVLHDRMPTPHAPRLGRHMFIVLLA